MEGRLSEGRRLLLAVVALAGFYILVIGLGDTRAWSGSDAGGKAATVRHMAVTRTWTPDVGYWAERFDVEGAYHPLLYTRHIGDDWVNATSLPFVYAAVPLWRVAGASGILVLPVLGSLLAAVAARRLARAIGAERGWGAFWLVGLLSPALFYAGDFWEHSLAVGLGLWAAALLMEHADDAGARGDTGRALTAGFLLGVAAVLRTELLVYAATLGAAVLLVRPLRRMWLRRPAPVLAGAIGLVVPLLANEAWEQVVLGGAVRSSRASAGVAGAGSELASRLGDGLLTTFALFPERSVKSYLTGAALVGCLLAAGWSTVGRRVPERLLLAGVAGTTGLVLARILAGPGFVPGFLPAAPVGVAGLAGLTGAPGHFSARPGARATTWAALLAVPVVWAFQWRGDIVPQWGGRYLLLSGALLTVVGAVALERGGWRRPPAMVLMVAAAAVTAFGATWHVQRTREVARAAESIEGAPSDVVLVTDVAHLPRELGASYGEHRWLMTPEREGLAGAVSVARAARARRLEVVEVDHGRRPLRLEGYAWVGTRKVPFLGVVLALYRYEAVIG